MGCDVCVDVGVKVGRVFGCDVEVSEGVGGAEVCVGVAGGGGGAFTVKLPELRLREIEFPPGSVALALLNESENVPGAAEDKTLTESAATVPFEIAVWFSPKMMILTLPLDGDDHARVLPADEAADPIDTLSTDMRLASKLRSKFNPVTSAPALDERLTLMLIPELPGKPEPLPAEIVALNDCA